ncbi:Heterokaryon incompatibility protein 6, OR allele [Colletotrichum sp. SAR 10_75]|nr:Heterokaryon incompatibility protein 6, OR allele [Colletotrichum sp. SAR 10_75]
MWVLEMILAEAGSGSSTRVRLLMSTITYREELSGQEIRLLRLLPGEWLEDLVAELYVADRDQDYVALSYAWGSTRRSNKIIVNRHVHFITFNLDRALRAIRRTTGSTVIWVDSVCINQEDAVEKSHQVGLMHDIFGSATEVIAYVGDGLDRSRQDYPRRFERLGLADPLSYWVLVRFLASPFANYWPRKESYSEDDIMIWDKHLQEDEECSLRISECIGDPPLFWTISSQAEIPASDDDLSLPLFTFTSDFNLRTDQKDVKSTRTWQEDESWVEDTIRAVASGSRLFVTSKGQLGLGPEKTRTGDAVCILEGGLMPHVLRKRSEKRGVTMVGTCYVEGLMHWGGEAGYHADNARDTEGLEHKLRRRLRDRDISEEDFLLY